jgi:hypothetical protein
MFNRRPANEMNHEWESTGGNWKVKAPKTHKFRNILKRKSVGETIEIRKQYENISIKLIFIAFQTVLGRNLECLRCSAALVSLCLLFAACFNFALRPHFLFEKRHLNTKLKE